MMAGPSTLLMLLAFLLGGGGSDLLDYIPSDYYWKQKQVDVSLDTLTKELKPVEGQDISKLIPDLDSADPQVRDSATKKIESVGPAALPELKKQAQSDEQEIAGRAKVMIRKIEANERPKAVRRLMAIRTLGEMKKKEALPSLEGMLKSDDMFVAEYAREAIERINGKEPVRKRPADMRDDVWMLPQECKAVGQFCPPGNLIDIQRALKNMPAFMGQNPQQMLDELYKNALQAAEKVGNIRFDGVTAGVSGDINNNTGFFVAIGRGKFDAHGIIDLMREEKLASNTVGSTEVFQPQDQMAILLPSDERIVFIAGPPGAALPTEQVIGNIKAKTGKLKEEVDMTKLIESMPADQPAWAVAQITPSFAQAPVLAPFKTLKLTTETKEDGLHFQIAADGKDVDKVKEAVQMTNGGIQMAIGQMQQAAQFVPPFKSLLEKFQTFKAQADGTDAKLTGNLGKSDSTLFMLPMMGFAARAEAAATQPAAPAPVPGQ